MTMRHESWTLPPGPLAPGIARSHVAEACRHLPRETVEVAQLLTSELVTNAVRYSAGIVRMVLDSTHDLRVEVQDQATEVPLPRVSAVTAEGGRGLMIVEAFADAWGTESQGTSKTVWFSLHAPGEP